MAVKIIKKPFEIVENLIEEFGYDANVDRLDN